MKSVYSGISSCHFARSSFSKQKLTELNLLLFLLNRETQRQANRREQDSIRKESHRAILNRYVSICTFNLQSSSFILKILLGRVSRFFSFFFLFVCFNHLRTKNCGNCESNVRDSGIKCRKKLLRAGPIFLPIITLSINREGDDAWCKRQ